MAFGLSSMSIFNSHCNHLIVSHTSTKTNCRRNSISVANYPCFLSLIRIQQPVTCARKTGRQGSSQPSRKLMLELASMVALNLNILPQPLNSLIGEFAQSDGNGIFLELQKVLRGGALNGWRRKKQSSRKLSGFVCVLICGMGLMCWKILGLDMFLKVSCFFFVGLSMIQLWQRKAFKEWILGFLFGIVLLSCYMGKEEMKFWVARLKIPSSAAQIVTKHRNRSRRKCGKAW
ncbi:uncharacterized protein LOC129288972 isoform X1 [Prosopis cineraria]|uniref:uncharacterized protein LOC129288972 isoform X1 n=1 Tax=Prosopis cineraria TaxID=364024 RepID=UPI00241067A5|nr:uncharacterized protein LOC129288972 isoform X1 [Prosopis cineraria]